MFGMSPEGYRALRQIEARAREARSRAERRDRFAMAALTGILAFPECEGSYEYISEQVYRIADAMEAEREKGHPK